MAIFLSEERKKPLEFETHVDTTELDFEQSVEKIISVIKENI